MMKKKNVSFLRISVFPVMLLSSLFLFVMLAGVAPANAETFLVGLHGQGVHAWEWPDGVSVTMTIYDAPSGNFLCTDTQTSPPDGEGFNFDLSGCPVIQPGYYVEMTDGTTTKNHVVMDLALTEVDTVNDTVAGTVNPNEWVAPGSPVLLIGDLDHLQVQTTDLSEIDVAQISLGDMAVVTFDALPELVLDGTVVSIAPKADEGAGVNFPVVIELDEIPPALRWGMTAFIDIELDRQ